MQSSPPSSMPGASTERLPKGPAVVLPPDEKFMIPHIGSLLVALGFAVIAFTFRYFQPSFEDHGLMTADAGLQLWHAGPAMLFFQFLKPTVMLLTLPLAWLGSTAYFGAQILASSVAVLLVGIVSEHLHGRGWPAALVMAASPWFLLSTITGGSNALAVCLLAVSMYLWIVRRSPVSAGLVLGMLPWCRFEYLLFVVLIAGVNLIRPDRWKLIIGIAIFPVVYLAAGGIYHHSALWFIQFPPEVAVAAGIREFDSVVLSAEYLAFMLYSLCMASPLWPLAFGRHWSDLAYEEKAFAAAMGLTFVALVVMPFAKLLDFTHSGRYWIMFCPMVAILTGAFRSNVAATRPRLVVATAAFLGGGALAILSYWSSGWGESAILGALPLSLPLAMIVLHRIPAVARQWIRGVSVFALVALVVSLTWFTFSKPSLGDGLIKRNTLQVAKWLRDQDPAVAASEVVTNIHLLKPAMALSSGEIAPKVRFLVQPDVHHILCRLTNHTNGQFAAIVETMRRYSSMGRYTWGCELGTLALDDTLFVMKQDYRLDSLLGVDFWQKHGDQIAHFGDIGVWRLRPGTQFEIKGDGGFPLDERCLIMCR